MRRAAAHLPDRHSAVVGARRFRSCGLGSALGNARRRNQRGQRPRAPAKRHAGPEGAVEVDDIELSRSFNDRSLRRQASHKRFKSRVYLGSYYTCEAGNNEGLGTLS